MIAEPPIKSSLTNQSAWLLFGKTIGFALSFLLPLLTVRYLAQDKVGVYRQSFQFITNAVAILPLGFSMSAFYFLSREPEKRLATVFNILLFNFAAGGLACLGLFLYPQFLGNIFQSAEMTRLAPLIGIVIWLWIFSTFLEIVALANQETRLAAAFIVSAQFTKTLFMACAVVVFTTVEAFLYAAILQAVLQTIVLIVYLNWRFPRFWLSFNFRFFREQIIYALPFGLSGLLYIIQTDLHNYFVGYRFSEAEYAIYAYGCFQLPLIGMLYESVSSVMIPRMSELESQGKKRQMIATTVSAMHKLALVYFPLFVFLMVTAEEFITTLFTAAYAASVPIFRINLLLLPFYCLMLDPIARSFPQVGRFLLKIRIMLFFVLIAALSVGIQRFDLSGMIAIVVGFVLFERLITLPKILGVLEFGRADVFLLEKVFRTAIAAAFSGAGLFLFYWMGRAMLLEACLSYSRRIMALIHFERMADFAGGSLFLGICALIFVFIYLLAANWLGAIEDEDKERINNFLGSRWTVFKNITRRTGTKNEDRLSTERRPVTTDR